MFGPELICNESINQNRAKRGFFWRRLPGNFEVINYRNNYRISSESYLLNSLINLWPVYSNFFAPTVAMTVSLKILHPPIPPNRKTQIPRYKFKLDQNSNFNLYREIPRNPPFSIRWLNKTIHTTNLFIQQNYS